MFKYILFGIIMCKVKILVVNALTDRVLNEQLYILSRKMMLCGAQLFSCKYKVTFPRNTGVSFHKFILRITSIELIFSSIKSMQYIQKKHRKDYGFTQPRSVCLYTYKSSLIFFLYFVILNMFFFTRRNKNQTGRNFAKARWARAIQKVRALLKTTDVLL